MIKFKELSWPNRIAIIGGWISVIVFSLSFVIGFIEGLLSVV